MRHVSTIKRFYEPEVSNSGTDAKTDIVVRSGPFRAEFGPFNDDDDPGHLEEFVRRFVSWPWGFCPTDRVDILLSRPVTFRVYRIPGIG